MENNLRQFLTSQKNRYGAEASTSEKAAEEDRESVFETDPLRPSLNQVYNDRARRRSPMEPCMLGQHEEVQTLQKYNSVCILPNSNFRGNVKCLGDGDDNISGVHYLSRASNY